MMNLSKSSLILSFLSLAVLSPTALANDDCVDAVVITADSSTLPFQTTGDVTFATGDAEFARAADPVGNLTCGISPRAIGVWYQIDVPSGGDTFLKATITDAPGTSTRFNAALFAGNSCSAKTCQQLGEYQMENQRTEPTMTWFAAEGMSYFLHVAGIDADEVGPFNLDIEEVSLASPPANDKCAATEMLGDMDSVTVDTTGAWPHGVMSQECSLQAASRGAFYKVKGTGHTMAVILSTSGEIGVDNEGRMELAIMTNGCRACHKVSDFLTASDMPHTLEFDTVKGQNYVVVLSGENFGDVGVFDITLEEGEPVPQDTPDATDMLAGNLSAAPSSSKAAFGVLAAGGLLMVNLF